MAITPRAPADDPEHWFERGVTDGLPVVPPTRERVDRMLGATTRDRQELVALVPPNFGRATVERIAVNAVMAGCRPDYLPVVLNRLPDLRTERPRHFGGVQSIENATQDELQRREPLLSVDHQLRRNGAGPHRQVLEHDRAEKVR